MTDKSESSEAFEARMIAQFNARVNKLSAEEQAAVKESIDKEGVCKDTQATEHNGPKGLEPTRYGDWEAKGRCHDF